MGASLRHRWIDTCSAQATNLCLLLGLVCSALVRSAKMAKGKQVPHTSPATWKSLLFHLGALYALTSAFQNMKAPSPLGNYITTQTGSWYQFLTVLGLCSAIITMSLAVLKDLIPSWKLLDVAKNTIGIVSVPVEGLISVLYWGLRAYDPALLVPPDPRYQIPLPLDLSLHAVPALILWIDFLFLSPPFSKKSRPWFLSILLTAGYTSWMEYCAQRNGNFPYPFFGEMDLPQRLTFYACAMVVNVGLFYAANGIHFMVDRLLGKNVAKAKRQAKGLRG